MKPVILPPVERPDRSRLYDEDFLEEMRAEPGAWFLLEEGREIRPSYGWAKKRIEGLEVATRKSTDDGTYSVYTRIAVG